jgi:hypothetical protein
MKHNIIKYLACAAVALGLASAVQGAAITGGVLFNGDFTSNGSGPALNTATVLTMLNDPSFSLSGSGTFAGAGVGNIQSFTMPYYVFPAGGGALSPSLAGQVMWIIKMGSVNYTFTVTSETQTWNPGANGGILNMQGAGNFSDDAADPTAAGTWNIAWTSSGAQFSFAGTDTVGTGVPDGGLTIMLLGTALSGLALLRRKLA